MAQRILTTKERNIYQQLCQTKETGVISVMYSFLNKKYDNIIRTGNYLIAFGDIPVGLVAHADTVFAIPPKDFFYDTDRNVMWSPEGMGADDRAGVFMIYKLIRETDLRPHIIITTGEEHGCIGALKLTGHMPQFTSDLKFLIELDRQGHDDSVYYDCANKDFEDFINKFGFISQWGSFSDIAVLAPAWKCAAVNLSVGYIHEHSQSEIICWDSFFNTMGKVVKILQEVKANKEIPTYEYVEDRLPTIYEESWVPDNILGNSTLVKCEACNKITTQDSVIPVFFEEDNNLPRDLCLDCYSKYSHITSICSYCGEQWVTKDHKTKDPLWVCPYCR